MNKYQEAYKRLSSRTYQYADKEGVYEDIEVLGELVEKATPEPPEKTKTNLRGILFDTYLCPECGNVVKDEKYCPKCGQFIDWSKEE